MSIWRKLFASTDSASYHPSNPLLGSLFGGGKTLAGVQVNDQTALYCSAVWAATRLYAASSGMIPLTVYERLPRGGQQEAPPDFYAQRLARRPNGRDNPFLYSAVETIHQINAGNGLAEIVRRGDGVPLETWRLHPSRVQPPRVRSDGQLVFDVSDSRGQREVLAENMLHNPNIISDDGVWGKGVITHARETVGTAIAHTRKGAADLGNRSIPPLVIKHPKSISDKARGNFREEWEMLHKGPDNEGRMAILQEGMEAQILAINNKDMEFIAFGLNTIEDISRWYSVPPHTINHLLRAHFNNITELSLQFVIYSLIPILSIKEAERNRKLLLPQDQDRYYFKYNVDSLLRGDPEKRSRSLQTQFMNGALMLDEWRALEERNPLPDGQGQAIFVPRSLIPIEQAIQGTPAAPRAATKPAQPAQPASPPAPPQKPRQSALVQQRLEALYAQAYTRLGRKEAQAARRAAKHPGEFLSWLDSFYGEHGDTLAEALLPVVEMHMALEGMTMTLAGALAREIATKRTSQRRETLLAVSGECKASELVNAVESFARDSEAVLPGQWASEDARSEFDALQPSA